MANRGDGGPWAITHGLDKAGILASAPDVHGFGKENTSVQHLVRHATIHINEGTSTLAYYLIYYVVALWEIRGNHNIFVIVG